MALRGHFGYKNNGIINMSKGFKLKKICFVGDSHTQYLIDGALTINLAADAKINQFNVSREINARQKADRDPIAKLLANKGTRDEIIKAQKQREANDKLNAQKRAAELAKVKKALNKAQN